MLRHYFTIAENGTAEIEIKKSRFICQLQRVSQESEAQHFIDAVKKEHWKAAHNCVAYLIGEQDEIQRAYDDGEPTGTAGVPMLEVLKKRELKNVAAVVTRYFGGTLLGTGGLIRAYGKAVSTALNEIGIVECTLQDEVQLTVPYPASGKLENTLRQSVYTIKDIQYTDQVTFVCLVDESLTALFKEQVTEWQNGQAIFKQVGQSYQETRIN